MKVTVNHKNLKTALSLVEKIVSRNPSLPILNNILIKTDNGRLKISSTNLEIGINYMIGAKIDEVGEIAIPARVSSDFINNVVDEKITLHTKNNILTINSDKYKTQILGFDPKDFPIIPKIKEKTATILSSGILRRLLCSVADSVAVSETRPELAGVYADFNSKRVVFAATDSFRLSEVIFDIKNASQCSIIIPRNTVMEMIRISSDIDGDLDIKIGDNQISFSNDDFELISRLVDGNYPDYKKVIPTKFLSRVLVEKNDLEKDIRLAGLFSSNISDVKLVCSEDSVTLKSKNSDKGEIETTIPAILKNDPFDISINYRYLLDGLKIMNSNKVVIEFTGNGNPLVLKPHDNDRGLTYLIMPLRS
ncbi:MAG: DNA polymerase III subunit beta [Candidatus Yanofskybacteria bacterium RIFCSPHIGHO2_01_FULL_42_12]|uniref:Beta sliding clamp n=1 Tax=Candidatus Yanofskybacteria bacterium RIFCSPLOWO2_01_FULL_42_49 TaxID=1802694 RepID=A0A1F8GCZ0_9BACT|nr:MAG: DNA polymerase III subunit beta [Candidatus Yanofskybacteria bacterium RIFCSPHIGHO2_01_FULL_42_12]OGN23193.1 MAG: DNA polymerase III subunit beta [Candidatus Yanofskybacteria bacterium RIFCSPLOWO2_01_FULL_42_49]